MNTQRKTITTLALALLFGMVLVATPATAATASTARTADTPQLTVDQQGKLVHHGALVRVSGTYTCTGEAVDLKVQLDQTSHAKGDTRVHGLTCGAGERGVRHWHATVPATQDRGLFLSGNVFIGLWLCPWDSPTVLIDLHAVIALF